MCCWAMLNVRESRILLILYKIKVPLLETRNHKVSVFTGSSYLRLFPSKLKQPISANKRIRKPCLSSNLLTGENSLSLPVSPTFALIVAYPPESFPETRFYK